MVPARRRLLFLDRLIHPDHHVAVIRHRFPPVSQFVIYSFPHFLVLTITSLLQSVDIGSKYLSEAPTFTISSHPSNICVSRQFLNHEFGGGEMQFTGVMDKIGGQRHHQKHHVMFPQRHQNPLMASIPGAPGLIYTGRTDLINYIWRMFGPVSGSSNPALWRYLGEQTYACWKSHTCGISMSATEGDYFKSWVLHRY